MIQMRRSARRSPRPWRRTRRGDSGVTLIEVVVATVVFGIMSSAILAIVMTSQAKSVDNRNRVAAANLAAREIELVREQFVATGSGPLDIAAAGLVTNPHPLTGGTAGQPLVLDGVPYTVVRSAAWNITGSGASACEGGSLVLYPSLVITTSVTWPQMGSTRPVVNTAVLAPEKGEGLPTTASFAAVTVKDAAGMPNVGRTVTVRSASESRSGVTDASGCAVIQLSPPAAGAEYTATFPDIGYVDITGTTSPSRVIGEIERGQLASSVEISIDRASTLRLRVTGAVTDGDVAGSAINLYQSEASGSAIRPATLTGLETTIPNLWPTDYTAFFGATVPSEMPAPVTLEPGGTGTLEVPFVFAEFSVSGAPTLGSFGTQLRATPPTGTCADSTARTVTASAGRLPSGTWSFWQYSAAWGCAAGPANVTLAPGPNGDTAWQPSTLTVASTPSAAGSLWVSPAATGAACSATNAVKVAATSGGTVGPVALPAGDWYVFAAPGTSSPTAPCASAGLVAVPYGAATAFTWPNSTVRVTNVPASGSSYRIIAVKTAITASCTTATPAGATLFSPNNTSTQSASLASGSWYLYRHVYSGGSGNRCTAMTGNPVVVAGQPSYTVSFTTGAVTTP